MKKTLVIRMDVDVEDHIEPLRVVEAFLNSYEADLDKMDNFVHAEDFLEAEFE